MASKTIHHYNSYRLMFKLNYSMVCFFFFGFYSLKKSLVVLVVVQQVFDLKKIMATI